MIIEKRNIIREWTKNGNKQKIESPHKTFNLRTNLIDNESNLITNTQTATYIRAYSETNCNGYKYECGCLQNIDLKYQCEQVREYIKKQNKNNTFWVTNFYIDAKFCTMLLNLQTNDLKIFSFAKNYKQKKLIEWLKNYLFIVKEG